MAVKDDVVVKLTAVAQALDSELLREAVNELISLRVRVAQLEAEVVTARAAAVLPAVASAPPASPVTKPTKTSSKTKVAAASAPSTPAVVAPVAPPKDPRIPSTCKIRELPAGEDYILEISETHLMNCGGTYNGDEFRVSTRKLRTWVVDNEYEFNYVESIVEACLRGASWTQSGRKFSFGDVPSWYKVLEPDADAVANDPVLRIECEVG